MPLTPETLARHELNGLHVEVVEAANPDLVGIAGRVVVETMKTLHVDCGVSTGSGRDDESDGSRVKQVPKRGTTFEFALPAGDEFGPDDRVGPTEEQTRTDEAAGFGRGPLDESPGATRRGRKAPGTASKRDSETSEARLRQSGSREGVAYVTVDGARLLSRPALRTENAGESTWR